MLQAPIAKKVPHSYTINSITIEDPYFWLRDPNWPKVQNPEIIKHLEAENKFAEESFFNKFKKDKEQIFQEIKNRIKLTDKSTERKKDDYFYYTRTEESKDYPIYCRRLGNNGEEEIILDVNELAKGHKYTKISRLAISPDQKLLAFGVDYEGNERFTIKVLDLTNKQYFDDKIDSTIGGIVWHEKLNGIFYTPVDENWRPTKVMFHKIAAKDPDLLIWEEKNPLYRLSIQATSSKKYLLIQTSGHQENQFHTIKFDDNNFEPKLFEPIRDNIYYTIDHNGDNFYIHTNDAGPNFRLAITNLQNTSSKYWQDYIPIDAKRYLSSFDLTQNYLILNYKSQGLPIIEVADLKTSEIKSIDFPDESYTAYGYSTNFDEDDVRVDYSSLARPDSTYSYNYTTGLLRVLKVQEIPGGFNPEEYEVKRVWSDNNGIKVPSTVFYKKSLMKKDGSNPLYLYGYGSYGISIPTSFRTSILSLVNRGFVFAIAHVRGGDDLGYQWYEDAKFLNKERTFEDFIAVTEDLIQKQYTSKGNIVICGGSAGGLLIGNVINSRPELYKAAIAHVPFVDVLNTMLDDTLPLTPGEYKEWGDPKNPEFFEYIKSYSPYDNVKKQAYPHLFITTSTSDPRVGYFEPAKWVAKLREHKTDSNLLLFKTNMDTGHQGASGRFDYLKEIADDYIFIFDVFNIKI